VLEEGWSKRRVIDTAAIVLAFAALSEFLIGDGTFRIVDVGGWAVFLIVMGAILWAISRMSTLWAESLIAGAGFGVVGALGDLFRGDGFDGLYLIITVAGGAIGWFVLFGVGRRFDRWLKSRRHEFT
jgi:hypothetical protein